MPDPKYIREGRFGAPKTWKTGSILGNAKKGIPSYPQPILHLSFDPGGHEICPDIDRANIIRYETYSRKYGIMPQPGNTPGPPNITVLDLAFRASQDFENTYAPSKDQDAFDDLVKIINCLRRYCPFKTIVVDPVTELSNSIWRHQAVVNPGALADARKWAGNIGMKVQQVIDYVCSLPANVVFIFHEEQNTNEVTKEVSVQPMVYSNLRNYVGGKFTQYFYQEMNGGKPMLRTRGFALIKGIGCRWPQHENDLIGPTFNEIYGKEMDVYR